MAIETTISRGSRTGEMLSRATRLQRENPSLPLLIVGLAVIAVSAGLEGGFNASTYPPVALLMLALLLVGLVALPRPTPSRMTLGAVVALFAYAGWTYVSISWAGQKGMAWDGANRTLLYALVFALFALWPLRGQAAALLLGGYALSIAGIGLVELLRTTGSNDPVAFIYEGRLSEPTGYANANTALWASAGWVTMVLAGRREVPALLRGLFLAATELLVALSVMGQSRSWEAVLPVMILLLLIVPGRARTLGAFALVGAGLTVLLGPLLDAYKDFDGRTPPSQYLPTTTNQILLVCAALLICGVVWALIDRRVEVSRDAGKRIAAGALAAFVLSIAAAGVAFTIRQGNPIDVASRIVKDFKKGAHEPVFKGARLSLEAGSYRYDFFRVALNNFRDHPIIGVGSDNYGRQYLRSGRQAQTPDYPHDLVLRVLSMTGLIGFALFAMTLIGGLVAAARARVRAPRGIGPPTAAAGILLFAYFFLHGSFDWLWEFPALGAAAFAALGIAGAIRASQRHAAPKALGTPTLVGGALLAGVLAVALTLPWLAHRDLEKGRSVAGRDPAEAMRLFDRAAALNPLSPTPYTNAALVAAGQGDLAEARRRLDQSLRREPGDPFAYLMLAAIASTVDRPATAVPLARKSLSENPRSDVARRVVRTLERGQVVTPKRVIDLTLADIDKRVGPR